MKIEDLVEAKMSYTPLAMGLSQLVGNNYALVGGYRSGSSRAGFTRLKYDIYDIGLIQTKGEEQAKIGICELFVEDGSNDINGLVNIEISSKARGSGVAREVVNDIVDTAGGKLYIHDIQRKAQGFWDRMGAEPVRDPENLPKGVRSTNNIWVIDKK